VRQTQGEPGRFHARRPGLRELTANRKLLTTNHLRRFDASSCGWPAIRDSSRRSESSNPGLRRTIMRFETLHALRGLNERTPRFFKIEALAEPSAEIKATAVEALLTLGTTRATATLKARLGLL
jgi:hypothetical protein